MTYIINQSAIIMFINGQTLRIEKSDKRFPKIMDCFNLPKEEQEDAIFEIATSVGQNVSSLHGKKGFEIVNDSVWYKGEVLPNALATKIKSILREGLPIESFEKFWENLEQNPTASSVNELMDFLEYKELPITEDGCFLAYKGVSMDYWSISGNTETVVVEGETNSGGQIKNSVGSRIEVKRRDVDDNRNHHCSFGLHVGSLKYASEFAPKLVIVKVNPKDVVSVPTDYNCQKCRVSAYEVLADYEGEIQSPVTTSDGVELATEEDTSRKNVIERVERYLQKKYNDGYEEVTVRQIQNSFSPDYPSKQQILDALQELGYSWYEEEGVTFVTID